MARCPFAEWRGPVPNKRAAGMVAEPHGLIPHVIVGSLRSADLIFHQANQQKSAHFGVGKDGHLVQWVETQDEAWAEAAGNATWWSAECEGLDTEPHTPAQLDTLAHLVVWLRTLSPFALQVTDDTNGQGVIPHRNGGASWGGHSCPGDKRHMQRADIVLRAQALELPPLPTPTVIVTAFPGDHMHRVDVANIALDGGGNGWVAVPNTQADHVVSIVAQGAFPPVDGYWDLPVFGRQQRGADTIIQISEASAKAVEQVSVWVADS